MPRLVRPSMEWSVKSCSSEPEQGPPLVRGTKDWEIARRRRAPFLGVRKAEFQDGKGG